MTVERLGEVVEAEIVPDWRERAQSIKGHLGRAVEGIVSAGRELIEAKAEVVHGEWLPMLAEIGIDRQTAHRLMKVAENTALSDVGNCQHFPTAIRALAELSRMDPSDIEAGIQSGAITPKTTIKEAREYAKKEKEVPAPAVEDTRAHKSPFAEGAKLTPDTDRTVILVGADGRAYTAAPDTQKAIEYARENPRVANWEAAREIGVSTSTISRAYGALRKNGEIPATGHTERSMADMFDLIAIGARNVGTSIDMYAGRISEAEPGDFDYYWEEFDQAVKKINSFRREIKRIHNI